MMSGGSERRPIISPERWRVLEPLLDGALTHPAADRGAYLDAACAGDAGLRAELDALLAECERAGTLLSRPVADRLAALREAAGGETADVDAQAIDRELGAAMAERYDVQREIGRGGMATVYLALDRRHKRRVALKVLRPDLAAALWAERFLREIEIAAGLTHPHILPLYDSGAAGGLLYYVMPYVEGESLRARLAREAPLAVGDVVRVLRDIADALAYAHAQGVVHRDIKPENVLLDASGHALVADFGIARALRAAAGIDAKPGGAPATLTVPGLVLGTPAYMAPEQAAGDPAADHRVDLYALGCVAYELLAGKAPFADRPTPQTLAAHLAEAPVPLVERRPDVPPALAALVMRLLAKHPDDRPPSAGDVLRDLEAQRSGGDSGSAAPRVRGGERKPRRALALASAGTLVLVALAGGAIARRTRDVPGPAGAAVARALDPKRVAVAVFANRTGDRALEPVGNMAADWVTRSLMETGLVDVVDAPTLYAQAADSGVAADPRGYAARNGAGTLVTGSYYRSADTLYFEATVRDAATGTVRRVIQPVTTPVSAPVRGVEALGPRVAGALAAELDVRVSQMGRLVSAPPTMDAYREFVAGQDAFWRADFNGAQVHFASAARLDTTFVLASAWLAAVSFGTPELCARADSVARALAARRHRLEMFVRTDVDVVAARCRGDAEGAYRLMKQRLEAYPLSKFARFGVATFASFALRSRETLATLRALDPDRDLGWMPPERTQYWTLLTITHHALGDHRAELDVARAFARRMPGRRIAVELEARALAGLGQDSAVLALLDAEALRPTDEDIGSLAFQVACELLAHGRVEAAKGAAARAVTALRARPAGAQGRDAPWTRWDLATMLSILGQDDRAISLVRGLVADESASYKVDYRGKLGVLAALRGEHAAAAQEDAWLAAYPATYLRGAPTLWRAKIAAASGDRANAVSRLREAIARGVNPLPWLHSDPDFTPLRGDPAFDALFRSRD